MKFMADFRNSSDQSTTAANKVITSFRTTLPIEMEALSKVHSDIQTDNAELNTTIVLKIDQLQKDLATENNLMDQLALKTEKAQLLSVKLTYANKHIEDMESEKAIVKCSVSDVNKYLQNLIESRDSLVTVSVRRHLANKLKPVFSMLNMIAGVSEHDALPKLGGDKETVTKNIGEPTDENEQKPKQQTLKSNPNDQKDNEAYGSKGKEKVTFDDEEEEQELSEGEKLIRNKHDKDLDDILCIRKKLEDQEMEANVTKVALETQKSLFPPWSLEIIQKEAVDDLSTHWLELFQYHSSWIIFLALNSTF